MTGRGPPEIIQPYMLPPALPFSQNRKEKKKERKEVSKASHAIFCTFPAENASYFTILWQTVATCSVKAV